jgi:hypothetical protein
MKVHNRQYWRYWFREGCEGAFAETFAANLCDQLEANQTDPFDYGERLLRFAVSISWRTLKLDMERGISVGNNARAAGRHWKDYLRGARPDVGQYSQHLFVAFDPNECWHKGLGGHVFSNSDLVLSQIGPLNIVGLFGRGYLSQKDRRIWNSSQLRRGGGTITPIFLWLPGTNVTRPLYPLLRWLETDMTRRILAVKSGS